MAPLPKFSVTGNLFDIPGANLAGELVTTAMTAATLTFSSNLRPPAIVLWEGNVERVWPVTVYVSEDGSISDEDNPVLLLANDDGLNVTGLQWTVQIAIHGSVLTSWTFDAKDDGETVDLGTVAHAPGVSVSGVAGLTELQLLALIEDVDSDVHDAIVALGSGFFNLPSTIHAATGKATPVDADELALVDSAASNGLKKLTWANLKATFKSYYDSVAANVTNKNLTSGNTFPTFNQNTTGSAATLTTPRNIDGQAFNGSSNITVIAPGTHAATGKTTPVSADEFPIVDSAASNVLKKVTFNNLKAAMGAAGAETSPPVFRVSTFYGGTLGGSDDTTCIQNTLDACHDAGGGKVVMPPNAWGVMWKAEQLIMRDGVWFDGSGWHSYALDGYTGGSKLQQLTGVNDDFIIIPGAGIVESDKFSVGCGITNFSLRGAAGSTGGHAINFHNLTEDIGIGPQDLVTLDHIEGLGFAGSIIHTTYAVPFYASYITGVGNGGYVIEVEETETDPTLGLVSQVVLQNISGDANMGYDDSGESGAVIALRGIQNQYSPAVGIFGVKSEYRAQPESGFGGAVAGNFNAVLIEDCDCPITISTVDHLGHEATKKCGDAIRIIGDVRPDLAWQAVNVRTFAAQVDGDAPFTVHDEVTDRGTNAPHGVWGPGGYVLDRIDVADDVTVVDFQATASAATQLRIISKPTVVLLQAASAVAANAYLGLAGQGTAGLYWYQSSGNWEILVDGTPTDVGANFITKNAGRLAENGNTAATWVAVPSTATSTGKVGQMAADSSFLYTCTATNTWRRVAHASW